MTRTDRALVITLVVLGCLVATAPFAIYLANDTSDEDGAAAKQRTEAWCDHVAATLDPPSAPFGSFVELTDALLRGELVEPEAAPPTSDEASLADWQRANRPFLDASFLASIEEYPHDLGFGLAKLQLAVDAAADGDLPSDRAVLRTVARDVDRFRDDVCG